MEPIERVLKAYGPALSRVASSYERSPAGRDELLQDIVLALWKAWPSFRGECSERAFVLRIAHNRGLTHAWRRPPPHEPLDEVPAAGEAPDQLVAASEQRVQLLEAVHALPLKHREVVLLLLEDLSHAEIAQVLGISENNVAVRLTRARAALRSAMNPGGA
ncbi:MAG: sigma-70 family RNA polymerase sigma factor [Myxococcota bacterium]